MNKSVINGVSAGSNYSNKTIRTGGKFSGRFFQALVDQMDNWLLALSDDTKITKAEASAVENNEYGAYLKSVEAKQSQGIVDETEDDEVLYDTATAPLFVTLKFNQISNLITILTQFENKKTEWQNAVNSMLKG